MVEPFEVLHFSQANPRGPGQGDVPRLLRLIADTIESLEARVQDIVFRTEVTEDGPWHSMTVYYHEKKA